MKKSKYNRFAQNSRYGTLAMSLAVMGLAVTPAFAAITPGGTNTYNGSTDPNGLGAGSSWDIGTPNGLSGAGSYTDLLFTGADGSTFTTSGGGNTNIYAESYNVTNGSAYTLQINSITSASFQAGATSSNGTSASTIPFTNSVSGVAQDLISLATGSSLTFNATNGGTGAPAFINVRQSGNFNIGTDSILTVNSAIAGVGTPAISITGDGTTLFNGANTYTGTTSVRGGTLEIAGTNTGSNVVINGLVNPSEPVLKLSNLNALPATAILSGSNSVNLDGTVDLAVAGAYIFDFYNRGNINFTASSGSPTSLHFTGDSLVTAGANSGRAFNNASGNLSIVFDSTLDIGGDVNASITLTGAGDTTVTGAVISTGDGARSLIKKGSGTLTLSAANAYVGTTTAGGGVLRLGDALALPGGVGATGGTSLLVFDGGIVGLTAATGDFARDIGAGPDQVQWDTGAATGGFAAYGGDRLVNFGGLGANVQWLVNGPFGGGGLRLGASDSDSKITIVNGINLSSASRTITVADGSAAVDAELAGANYSAAGSLVKAGLGTLSLTGVNTYGGGTTVLEGILMIKGDSLDNSGSLVIDGGKVNLTGAETVDTLFFGAVQQAAGTYSSDGTGGTIASVNFTGSGTLIVTTDPSGSDYTTWATSFGLENPWLGVDPALNGESTADPDNDGLSNQDEYAFGLIPNSGSSVNPIIVPLNKTTGTFTFTRRLPSLTSLTYAYGYSTTLSGAWLPFTPVSEISNSGDPVEQIIVTVPAAQLAEPKLFVRVTAQ